MSLIYDPNMIMKLVVFLRKVRSHRKTQISVGKSYVFHQSMLQKKSISYGGNSFNGHPSFSWTQNMEMR